MSYKVPGVPSKKAYIVELADFWEIEAIKQKRPISIVDIARILSPESDEISHDGIESEDDVIDERLEYVLSEFFRRKKACTGIRYPFQLKTSSIVFNSEDDNDAFRLIYLFLLFCTRFNMSNNKEQGGIDGTEIFESLCSIVAENYFGKNSKSVVLGTSVTGNFEHKVQNLINQLKEGTEFRNRNITTPKKNDGGVDVVVWKEFADKRESKLIGFGQCKTGTSWHDNIKLLNPDEFCKRWFLDQPILSPVPIAFIADTLNFENDFPGIQSGFLFFSRFRIMEYLPDNLDEEFISDIKKWVESALNLVEV